MSDGSLAEQLVQAASKAINDAYERTTVKDPSDSDARAAVVAALRTLAADSAGYPELVTTDDLLALADEIEEGNPRE